MSDIRLEQAIKEINQNAEFSIREKDVDKITWLNGTNAISKTDILAKQAELQTAYDNNAYARKRAIEYPSIKDFMEAYTEKEIGSNSTKWDAYVTKYNKVRTENPKS